MKLSFEQRYANLLVGSKDRSPLNAPGYKFSMAQAGFPLRHEVFCLHHRRGGPLFMPFDFGQVTLELMPRLPHKKEAAYLAKHGYTLTAAMEAALVKPLEKPDGWSAGDWVNPQEPILTVYGTSFQVSWLEDLVIAYRFPMQIATAIKDGRTKFMATCEAEAEIINLVAEAMGTVVHVDVDEDTFKARIRSRLRKLSAALGGDIDRAFEVGTRSMSCMAQHRIILEECKEAGMTRTANVRLAYELDMIPVGTTGHEHQMRHGDDLAGFRAVRDRRPQVPSNLFDTYNPEKIGIPAAITMMLEDRSRQASNRFDSGDQEAQFILFMDFEKFYGISIILPLYIFMDGYDDKRTAQMEKFVSSFTMPGTTIPRVQPERRHYGIGGFLNPGLEGTLSRNAIAMVYKLTMTGGPQGNFKCVRKWSGTPGKESPTGWLTVFIAKDGTRTICQRGEDFGSLSSEELASIRPTKPSIISNATKHLIDRCWERDVLSKLPREK